MKSARNIYRDDVDFASLALQSPDFAKWYANYQVWTDPNFSSLKPNGQLDFTDPNSVRYDRRSGTCKPACLLTLADN